MILERFGRRRRWFSAGAAYSPFVFSDRMLYGLADRIVNAMRPAAPTGCGRNKIRPDKSSIGVSDEAVAPRLRQPAFAQIKVAMHAKQWPILRPCNIMPGPDMAFRAVPYALPPGHMVCAIKDAKLPNVRRAKTAFAGMQRHSTEVTENEKV